MAGFERYALTGVDLAPLVGWMVAHGAHGLETPAAREVANTARLVA